MNIVFSCLLLLLFKEEIIRRRRCNFLTQPRQLQSRKLSLLKRAGPYLLFLFGSEVKFVVLKHKVALPFLILLFNKYLRKRFERSAYLQPALLTRNKHPEWVMVFGH